MDCMEYMKTLPDNAFDLAVVDPPYGINVASHANGQVVGGGARPFGGNKNLVWAKPKSYGSSKPYHTFADDRPPDEGYFKELARVSKRRIIWGGNFMLDYLGAASCMIVWDKKRRGMDQADCEIAWTNLNGQSRIFDYLWNGMLQENMKKKEQRIHPTQKPVALYAWIFRNYAKPGMKILDTHLGSGSSRIAAWDAGLDFVGTEIDETYFNLQEERFKKHIAQGTIFDTEMDAQAEQISLLNAALNTKNPCYNVSVKM